MESRSGPIAVADGVTQSPNRAENRHIVDQLIEERSVQLSQHVLWPVAKPLLLRFFHYRKAVRMCDDVADMSGWDAFSHLSKLLDLKITVRGLENLPRRGGFILAPCHPTGIADGIAVFDVLKNVRPDMAIFANRDAQRAAPELVDPAGQPVKPCRCRKTSTNAA